MALAPPSMPPGVNGSRMSGANPRTKTAPLKSTTSTHSTPSSLSPVSAVVGGSIEGPIAPPLGGIVSCLDYGLDEDAILARKLAEQMAAAPPERVKRGRKSKTDAMTAMSAQAEKTAQGSAGRATPTSTGAKKDGTKPSTATTKAEQPGPARNPMRKAQKLEKAPALNMATVRTVAPREEPPPRTKPRLFGLEHCPVFYPTVEEFAQPMVYMQKIGQKAREYGILKVVPPEGWKPPFVLDTETFRFKTRLQRLNSMEASARANINFLEQLYLFHKQQGMARIKVPIVNGRPVDLWRLRKEVNLLGGFDVVTAKRKWATLAKSIGYDVKTYPAISFQLKTAFQKIIAPFEEYLSRVKGGADGKKTPAPPSASRSPGSVSLSPPPSDGPKTPDTARTAEAKVAIVSQTPDAARVPKLEADDSPVTIERVQQAAMKLNSVLAANVGEEEPRARTLEVANPAFEGIATGWEDPPDRGGEICEICGLDEDDPNILLCDCCDKGYHLQCLNPPLDAVPDGNWYCDACIISTGNEFGFEEGKEHSLHSFQRRADGFKRAWLERHPLPPDAALKIFASAGEPKSVPAATAPTSTDSTAAASASAPAWQSLEFREELAVEDHFEREFWRLVESNMESVEIEYGADVHSSTFGSGLPTLESHPLEPYARDGWNLNNLPITPGSLLRYIKSDIAGMTRPWLYVGMVFSTFAWHKEDHYTYSINYHHWGDTKTWYGVPGADDMKLEEAMKNAAPELFEQQPDLMYQLVTLLSPGRLKRNGVRTYVCDQRPNEFVITCPRSYHAGFNHGLNFNEAVNFCLPDWISDGLLCVQHYRSLNKIPVFSHDELLITLSQFEKNPRSSRWLLPHFKEMVEREQQARAASLASIEGLAEVVVENDLPESKFQCHHCKSFSYLSHIISPGCPHTACHDHTHVLGNGPKIMRMRWSNDALAHMLHRVKARSDKAGRVGDLSLTGEPIEQRTSGRKRKPSAALLEAAGAGMQHISQRMKTSHRPSPGLAPIAEDDMDIDQPSTSPDEDVKGGVNSDASQTPDGDVGMDDIEEVIQSRASVDVTPEDDELDELDEEEALSTSQTIAMAAPDPVPALSVSPSRPHGNPHPVRRVPWSMTTDPPSPKPSTSQSASGSDANVEPVPAPKPKRERKPRPLKPPSFTKNGKRRGRPPKSEAGLAASSGANQSPAWEQYGVGPEFVGAGASSGYPAPQAGPPPPSAVAKHRDPSIDAPYPAHRTVSRQHPQDSGPPQRPPVPKPESAGSWQPAPSLEEKSAPIQSRSPFPPQSFATPSAEAGPSRRWVAVKPELPGWMACAGPTASKPEALSPTPASGSTPSVLADPRSPPRWLGSKLDLSQFALPDIPAFKAGPKATGVHTNIYYVDPDSPPHHSSAASPSDAKPGQPPADSMKAKYTVPAIPSFQSLKRAKRRETEVQELANPPAQADATPEPAQPGSLRARYLVKDIPPFRGSK